MLRAGRERANEYIYSFRKNGYDHYLWFWSTLNLSDFSVISKICLLPSKFLATENNNIMKHEKFITMVRKLKLK